LHVSLFSGTKELIKQIINSEINIFVSEQEFVENRIQINVIITSIDHYLEENSDILIKHYELIFLIYPYFNRKDIFIQILLEDNIPGLKDSWMFIIWLSS
jgi:hypothetical protein